METLIGVLLDVSGSMQASIGERPTQKGQNQKASSWARSIFKVVDGLIKHDVSSSNHVFALAFGANRIPLAFDLLGTVAANMKALPYPYNNKTKAEIVEELSLFIVNEIRPVPEWLNVDILIEVMTKSDACFIVKELNLNFNFRSEFLSKLCEFQHDHNILPLRKATLMVRLAKRLLNVDILEEILTILEQNGAPRVRTWAKMEVLLDVVDLSVACSFLDQLKLSQTFKRRFVQECLPESCRKVVISTKSLAAEALNCSVFKLIPQAQEYATRESVEEAVAKGKLLLSEFLVLKPIGQEAIMDVHQASEILHGGIGEEELTNKRVDELMDAVEPLIYGGTPLMRTIEEAKKFFATERFKDHTKLMFIISDGQPGDGSDPPMKELALLGVKTVCCYITNDAIADPKHLYSTQCETWDEASKLMFQMSSTITTQVIPRTIFVKRGWSIDITNNETRLFFQVNHPDIIEEVCELAREVVCCQDALSDILTTVSLDLYINQANQGFVPKRQEGGTCYANASAAVLHLAMQRIVGRDGGYPDFFDLRKKMITKYGEHGANTLKVLQEICPEYRLHCKEVDVLGAMKAIAAKRPVLARFWLTDPEWDMFEKFYKQNPQGVLTSAILEIKRREPLPWPWLLWACPWLWQWLWPEAKLIGHAVVLTSFNSECLRLMNSWGSDWADGGFFKVSNADVLGLEFMDVFWTKDDLKQSEIVAYDREGATIAKQLFSKLQGLQTIQYICPLCYQSSKVSDFTGHHLEAKCPKCNEAFKISDVGDDLALNMYLLSLSANGQ